jgi:hypothetical protein
MQIGDLVRVKQNTIRSHHTDRLKRIARDRIPMLIIELSKPFSSRDALRGQQSCMLLCEGVKFVILHESLTQQGMR